MAILKRITAPFYCLTTYLILDPLIVNAPHIAKIIRFILGNLDGSFYHNSFYKLLNFFVLSETSLLKRRQSWIVTSCSRLRHTWRACSSWGEPPVTSAGWLSPYTTSGTWKTTNFWWEAVECSLHWTTIWGSVWILSNYVVAIFI